MWKIGKKWSTPWLPWLGATRMEILERGWIAAATEAEKKWLVKYSRLYMPLHFSTPLSQSPSFLIPLTNCETDGMQSSSHLSSTYQFSDQATSSKCLHVILDPRGQHQKPQIKISTNRRTYFWKMLSMLTKSMRRATPTRSFSAMSEMNMNRFDDAALKVWKKTLFSNARNGEICLRDPPPLLVPPNHSVTL